MSAANPDLLPLSSLRVEDLAASERTFSDGLNVYETTGQKLGHGGMGNVWRLVRRPPVAGSPSTVVVGKTFRDEFLLLLRNDAAARRRFEHFQEVVARLRRLSHPNLLQVEALAPIVDNYLLITPLGGPSLLELMPTKPFTAIERVRLFIDALRGLDALHQQGIVHRDFTLNNVLVKLVDGEPTGALVFDFDLAVAPQLLRPEERTYGGYYAGHVFGAPEFSVAPELLDEELETSPISPRIDVYAAGTALFALFCDASVYGEPPDLAALFFRIAEGVVRSGETIVVFPDSIPLPLHPIINTCLERDPTARFVDAGALVVALEGALDAMTLARLEPATTFRRTGRLGQFPPRFATTDAERRERTSHAEVPAEEADELTRLDGLLAKHGYAIERALGRVKGHPILLARPRPELIADGTFPEANPYPKIVTAIDLTTKDPGYLDRWLQRIFPILTRVRQGALTALYKIAPEGERLLLFSEYVDDPRFGTALAAHDLTLEETLGLGYLVAQTLSRLHNEGLAHNNVRAESLVFKGNRDTGRVQSFFVGLVEPSLEPEALQADVRNLAGLIAPLIKPRRIAALRATLRPILETLRQRLTKMASGEVRTVSLPAFIELLADGLGAIDGTFDLVRAHHGSTTGYADLLIRHSLYNRLYGAVV